MSFLSKTFRYVNELGDSLTFTYDKGYLINKPEGVDTVSVTMTEAQGINQVGSTIQSANVQSRPVNVSGRLVGDNQALRKERLLSVIRPDLTGRLYADDYYLEVRPTETPVIEPRAQLAAFSFSLLAPYPYWRRDEKAAMALRGLQYMFKLPCNFSKPYRFAQYMESAFINVQNRGQVPIPFRVTFHAVQPCKNPKIINANTGQYLLLNKEMAEGERIVVDITHGRTTVTSSKDGDIRGALSLQSRLNRLAVGDNILKTVADEGEIHLEATIEYATEIVGVAL